MKHQYIGTFSKKVDSKNRIILPASFGIEVDEAVIIQRFEDHIEVWLAKDWNLRVPKSPKERRQMLAGSERAAVTTQRRLLLPASVREGLEIEAGTRVRVLGVGDRIEIWRIQL